MSYNRQEMIPRAQPHGEHMRHSPAENLGIQDSHAQIKGETKQNLLCPIIQEYSKKICLLRQQKKKKKKRGNNCFLRFATMG